MDSYKLAEVSLLRTSRLSHILVISLLLIHDPLVSHTKFLVLIPKPAVNLQPTSPLSLSPSSSQRTAGRRPFIIRALITTLKNHTGSST